MNEIFKINMHFDEKGEEIEKIIKKFLSLEKPNPEFMKVIINRIEIHQEKQVDIYFNFKGLNYIKNRKM